MGGLRCIDGSSLEVLPVPSRDTGGMPYEVTLELIRDGRSFGEVGQRCGYLLGRVALGLAEARTRPDWPDPDDRFPEPEELFAFRHRDRVDCHGVGELRCTVRTSSVWRPESGWRVGRRAMVEAWGDEGLGVRAELTSAELAGFISGVLSEIRDATDCFDGETNRVSRR
jgi:hypothetical protein